MQIQFKRPPKLPQLVGLPASVPNDAPPESLNVNLQVHMTGFFTIMVIAPDDDQKLFLLVPEAERPKMINERPWVQDTMRILEPALNTILEQTLLKMHLYPVGNVVQPGCAIDQAGKLVYTFQVPVQTFPAGAAPVQQGVLPATDGSTVQ